MSRTIEQNFADWEGSTFGYGYGSGEEHIIPALRKFMELCTPRHHPESFAYDFRELEQELTPAVTWFLINILCRYQVGMIEYGTSPRFAWLTDRGKALRDFMLSKTVDELVMLATSRTEADPGCSPDACNCGPEGYQEGVVCDNPFWKPRR